jgi:hypothetical protein
MRITINYPCFAPEKSSFALQPTQRRTHSSLGQATLHSGGGKLSGSSLTLLRCVQAVQYSGGGNSWCLVDGASLYVGFFLSLMCGADEASAGICNGTTKNWRSLRLSMEIHCSVCHCNEALLHYPHHICQSSAFAPSEHVPSSPAAVH